jgi:hypothetical protein
MSPMIILTAFITNVEQASSVILNSVDVFIG